MTSISLLGNNAFAGYNEISYFHAAYFDTVANPQNVDTFSTTKFYNEYYSAQGPNFDYLFATFDTTIGPGTEPPPNSLYNLENMKTLV